MSQVSKFIVKPELWEKIFNLFVEAILGIKNKNELEGFIGNFFTPTEKIMFAKRFAAAVMLAKGTDYTTIRKTLRISPPTIARMSFRIKYESEGMSPVIERALRKDAARILLEELSGLFDIPGKGKSLALVKKRSLERRKKIAGLRKGL